MKNKKYESPKVDFQQMKLLERVADTCWGYAYAWYDADGNGKIEGKEKVNLSKIGLGTNGCQGKSARDALKNYYESLGAVGLTDIDVSTNTKSKTIHGGNS